MMKTKNTGERYYKVVDGKAVVGTVVNIYEDGNVKMRFEDGTTSVIDLSKEHMTKLKPDGYLVIALVSMGDPVEKYGYDVIVSLNRRVDVEDTVIKNNAWAICRQNINNFYMSNMNTNSNVQYVGMSCCKDTIPEGVDFPNALLSCHKIVDSMVQSVYFDTTLDDIIRCMNKSLLQRIDSTLYMMHKSMKDSQFVGFEKSLKDLLDTTSFMTDFLLGYDIRSVEFEIDIIEEQGHVSIETLEALEDYIKHEIHDAWAIPYDKYTNLKAIDMDKLLVCTPKGKLWVIGYIKGIYSNKTYMSFDDKQELEVMKHNFPI